MASSFGGKRFDREFRGIFAIEDEISSQVARALSSTLRVSGSLASRRTSNAEAYRLYLMGRHLIWQHNRAPIWQGIQLEEESVAKDPGFAPAHCSIALGYLFLIQLGAVDLREATAKMSASASKALELDDRLPEAHALMGGVRGIDDYDWAGCKRECRRALELDPDDMIGLDGRATQAIVMGQFDEAYKDRAHIRDLDPTVPLNHLGVCWPLMYAGRHEEALVHIRRSLELDPAFARGHQALGTVYRLQGKSAESVDEDLKAAELSGGDLTIAAQLRGAFQKAGLAGYDRKRLDLALSRPKPSYFNLASIFRDLGDYGKSMDYLEKSYDEHPLGLIWIKTFPPWKPLREFPRFGALLKRMGLEPPTLV
jgi:tetratricopeptide (TPR) repeat protein